jgi:hypothetical protein
MWQHFTVVGVLHRDMLLEATSSQKVRGAYSRSLTLSVTEFEMTLKLSNM